MITEKQKAAVEAWMKSYEDLAKGHPRSYFGHDNAADAEEARKLADMIEAATSTKEIRLMADNFHDAAWNHTDDDGEPMDDPSELYLDASTICGCLAGKEPSRDLPEEFEKAMKRAGIWR